MAGIIGGFTGSLVSGLLYNTIGFRWLLRLNAVLDLVPLYLINLIDEDKKSTIRTVSKCSCLFQKFLGDSRGST